jgi:hypothetical protein
MGVKEAKPSHEGLIPPRPLSSIGSGILENDAMCNFLVKVPLLQRDLGGSSFSPVHPAISIHERESPQHHTIGYA